MKISYGYFISIIDPILIPECRYVAQDKNGCVFGYENKPFINEKEKHDHWSPSGGFHFMIQDSRVSWPFVIEPEADWKETLRIT